MEEESAYKRMLLFFFFFFLFFLVLFPFYLNFRTPSSEKPPFLLHGSCCGFHDTLVDPRCFGQPFPLSPCLYRPIPSFFLSSRSSQIPSLRRHPPLNPLP